MRSAWGVDQNRSGLSAVLLVEDGGATPTVSLAQALRFPGTSSVTPQAVAAEVVQQFNERCQVDRGVIVLGLPSEVVSPRYLALSAELLDGQSGRLRAELAPRFPIPLDEAVWDWCPLGGIGARYEGEQDVAVFALPIEQRDAWLTPWTTCGVKPVAVIPSTVALANLLAFAVDGLRGPVAVAAVEARTTELVVIAGARLWSHPFPNDYAAPADGKWRKDIADELYRLLGFLAVLDHCPVRELFLVGGASRTSGLADLLEQRLELRPLGLPGDLAAAVGVDYAVAAGLALQGLGRTRWPVDLGADQAAVGAPRAQLPHAGMPQPPRPVWEESDRRFGVVLCRITSLAKRGKAAAILMEIRGIPFEDAWALTGRTIIPALVDVTSGEAEQVLERFRAARIAGRVTKRRAPLT